MFAFYNEPFETIIQDDLFLRLDEPYNRFENDLFELNFRHSDSNNDENENSIFIIRRNIRNHILIEHLDLKEIKSDNNNFIKEKDIKYDIYPLYINWKKIESKSITNTYFNVFKLFGYFGVAVYDIFIESMSDNNNCNYKNFIGELSKLYKKEYKKEEIEEKKFYKKIMNIKDDVFSLVKNKIIIFKEISIFLIILKFYQAIYCSLNNKTNIIDSLKYQFIILSYIKNDEYEKIYNTYLRKFKIGRYLGFNVFQRNKEEYHKSIKNDYKKYKK